MSYLLYILIMQPKSRVMLLIPIVCAVAIAELVSIYSIYPFVKAASGEELPSFVGELFAYFGVDESNIILHLGFVSFLAVVFAGIIRAFGHSYIISFNHGFRNIITKRVIKSYLYSDYLSALKIDKQEIESSLFTDTDMLISTVFTPVTNILNSLVVLTFTLMLLLWLDWQATFIALSFFSAIYLVITQVAFKYLRRFSVTREKSNLKRYNAINSILSLFKHIKINNTQDVYLNSAYSNTVSFSKSIESSQKISIIPKFLIESLGFGIILFYLIVQVNTGGDVAKVAVFAFAGYRMMPLIQNIYSGLSQIKYGIPILRKISAFLTKMELEESTKLCKAGLKGIRVNDVDFAYSPDSNPILSGVTLDIHQGDSVGIVGKTGSGKSTFIDIISGLLIPTSGNVEFFLEGSGTLNQKSERTKIAYVDQNVILENTTIRENIKDNLSVTDDKILQLAESLGIDEDFKPGGSLALDRDVRRNGDNLSGGQKQRISILRAICKEPEMLILDEATSALDNETQSRVIDGIHQSGDIKILISIAHRVEALNKCNVLYRVADNGVTKIDKL